MNKEAFRGGGPVHCDLEVRTSGPQYFDFVLRDFFVFQNEVLRIALEVLWFVLNEYLIFNILIMSNFLNIPKSQILNICGYIYSLSLAL